jgi:hypothetical protein
MGTLHPLGRVGEISDVVDGIPVSRARLFSSPARSCTSTADRRWTVTTPGLSDCPVEIYSASSFADCAIRNREKLKPTPQGGWIAPEKQLSCEPPFKLLGLAHLASDAVADGHFCS